MMQEANIMQSSITMSKESKKRSSDLAAKLLKYSVGIDMGKAEFVACVSSINFEQRFKVIASRKFANTGKGFNLFFSWVKQKTRLEERIVFCMESTGVYYENLAYFLADAGCCVSVILPNKSKNYLKSLGLKSKNDKIDAQGLAQMGAEQNLEPWRKPKQLFIELRSLTRQRQNLQENRTALSNQLEAFQNAKYVSPKVVESLKSLIDSIDTEVIKLEKEIKTLMEQDQEIHQKMKAICVIKGLSLISLATIVAETLGFAQFTNQRQLTKYAGYDVVENQSGKHVGRTRISKKGNSRIRRILHMPAFTAITHGEKPFVALWNRVYERTKIKMKAYVAVQRKMLVLIYTLWTKGGTYDPEHLVMQS